MKLLKGHELQYIKARTPKPKVLQIGNRAYQVWADKWPKKGIVNVSTISEKELTFAKGPTKKEADERQNHFSWEHS